MIACVCVCMFITLSGSYIWPHFFSLLLLGCFLFTVQGFLFTESVLESKERRPAAEFQSVGVTPQSPHGS